MATSNYAIITGANSGLGLSSTLALIERGYKILMACRDEGRAKQALAQVKERFPQAQVSYALLDLANLSSVRSFAHSLLQQGEPIDCLLNNAGIMMIPYQLTADGFEMQFGTNHLGHFALTGLLLPLLGQHKERPSRVVTVSSIYHRMGKLDNLEHIHAMGRYNRQQAYGDAKLANLLFAIKLDQKAKAHGLAIQSLAAHPGYAATNLQTYGAKLAGSKLGVWLAEQANRIFAQSSEQGAMPQVEACSAEKLRGGEYLGPQGWMELWGPSGPAVPSKRALDEQLGQRLWDISEQWTEVRYPWSTRLAQTA